MFVTNRDYRYTTRDNNGTIYTSNLEGPPNAFKLIAYYYIVWVWMYGCGHRLQRDLTLLPAINEVQIEESAKTRRGVREYSPEER